jgi:hypothetical protein
VAWWTRRTGFDVDDEGVRKIRRGRVIEAVNWNDLSKVTARTTDAGPGSPDVFLMFHSRRGSGVSIPQSSPEAETALKRVQMFQGFDQAALVEAMGCTTDRTFTCWESQDRMDPD